MTLFARPLRRTHKLEALLALIDAGAGEKGIYALAAAARRPYRRVHDQVQRLAAAGAVRLDKRRRGSRTCTSVRPAARPSHPELSFDRAWSRPSGGLEADTVIAQVVARPTFGDLLACAQHYGLERVRAVYQMMVRGLELAPGAVAASGRMLTNIEVGHARAAGIN